MIEANDTQTSEIQPVAAAPHGSEERRLATFHMGQSITGPLRNWKAKDWKLGTKYITRNDGSKYTAEELKDVFLKELAMGHEVVPIGDCDNWDWKKGCRGHPQNGQSAGTAD